MSLGEATLQRNAVRRLADFPIRLRQHLRSLGLQESLGLRLIRLPPKHGIQLLRPGIIYIDFFLPTLRDLP